MNQPQDSAYQYRGAHWSDGVNEEMGRENTQDECLFSTLFVPDIL